MVFSEVFFGLVSSCPVKITVLTIAPFKNLAGRKRGGLLLSLRLGVGFGSVRCSFLCFEMMRSSQTGHCRLELTLCLKSS